MPTIYALKPAFLNLLGPLTRHLAQQGVTANQVTLAATVLSVILGLLICLFPSPKILLVLPLFLLLRMALNAIDGLLAREYHMKSSLGAILNELGDVISDTALYLPLALIPGFNGLVVILIVILAIMSEMTGVIATQIGAKRRYDGPMGKSDRAFIFGLIGLLMGFGFSGGLWLDSLLYGILLLLCITIINRARGALREVKP